MGHGVGERVQRARAFCHTGSPASWTHAFGRSSAFDRDFGGRHPAERIGQRGGGIRRHAV
jgi:hypothetical protein